MVASLFGDTRQEHVKLLSADSRVLKFSYRGAPQTCQTMRHAALASQQHMPVRLMAEQVCQGLQSKDYASEALALYYFVLSHTRYMRDPRTIELVRAPYVVVNEMLAGKTPSLDCDDLSAFLAALLLATGCECRFATVAFRKVYYNGEPQYSHVFVQAREPKSGSWLTLDPVAAERTPQMLNRVQQVAFWPVA